jgi:hypothetical protein
VSLEAREAAPETLSPFSFLPINAKFQVARSSETAIEDPVDQGIVLLFDPRSCWRLFEVIIP